MNLKRIIILLFLTNGMLSIGQITYEYDTLSMDRKMLGATDSVDYNTADLPTTFDGGRSILSQDGLSINRFANDYRGFRFRASSEWQKMQFSALPYIGFSYSVGGQSSQYLKVKYAQAFSDSLLFNLGYERSNGLGFIRNTAFATNHIQIQLEWKTRNYAMQFHAAYKNDSSAHAGGLLSDSLVIPLGLEFAPIRKANASSNSQFGKLALNNYINFNPNTDGKFGLLTKHTYEITNKRYHEVDTIFGIYNMVNIDSATTFDRYTLASITNEAGLYFTKKHSYFDGRIGHRYWSFGNMGNEYDTTEIDLRSTSRWQFGKLSFMNEFHFNLIGGFNAFSDKFSASLTTNRWRGNGTISFENTAPVPVKRSYFANNYDYLQTSISLQQTLRAQTSIDYTFADDTTRIGAAFEYLQMNNVYLFDDTTWNPTSTGINALQLGVNGNFQLGKWHFQPTVKYTVQSQGYLPAVQGYLRCYLKSYVFKAKKLLLVLGVDASYTTGFNHRVYTPSMDAYTWYQSSGEIGALANLHAFTAIEVSTFRFFVRYENIGSFWSNKVEQEVSGYPIAGTRFRIGITWDFFN
ncbi:MAG: hypothetical protein ACI837_000397 [Crocinitomicaceae bacterium]|jgi:hypothetical protein